MSSNSLMPEGEQWDMPNVWPPLEHMLIMGLYNSGLKQAMEWVGFYGGPSRKPLLDLHEPEKVALRKTFTANGFL